MLKNLQSNDASVLLSTCISTTILNVNGLQYANDVVGWFLHTLCTHMQFRAAKSRWTNICWARYSIPFAICRHILCRSFRTDNTYMEIWSHLWPDLHGKIPFADLTVYKINYNVWVAKYEHLWFYHQWAIAICNAAINFCQYWGW